MIHIVNEKRVYNSQLRQEQMEKTRDQIIEGLIKTMGNGAVTWSIPDVARVAGVSVPTVYRYFPNKEALVAGLGEYIKRKTALSGMKMAQTPEELAQNIRLLFKSYDGLDEAMRLMSVSPSASEMRADLRPLRIKMMEVALAPVLERFNERDQERLKRMVVVLSSSSMVRAFHEYLDLSGEETADIVAWTILTLAYAGSLSEAQEAQDSVPGEE